uniref:DUF4283 domain-containing protein n=1 Tax=Ananas comosus var. bracteatus TaxID=296719 RepID=A0A6V7PX62_ANACO|nr:unnamed protein product [Ananas comosus var. bracteatus]
MNRAMQHGGRPARAKVYVPYTEEYLRRVDLRRNALLADVIQPANLGPDPISTIKSALASRFGGYNDDFAVARHRDRHFAIFLPEWVPAEVLSRREVLTLNGFWLRCFPWGQYRDARPHRVHYRAWIRLINLPFEIWTVPRVAALHSTKFVGDRRRRVFPGYGPSGEVGETRRWRRSGTPAPPRNARGEAAGDRNDGQHAGDADEQADEAMDDASGELEDVEPLPPSLGAPRASPVPRGPRGIHFSAPVACGRAVAGRGHRDATGCCGAGSQKPRARASRQVERDTTPAVYTKKVVSRSGVSKPVLRASASSSASYSSLAPRPPRVENSTYCVVGGTEAFFISGQASFLAPKQVCKSDWSKAQVSLLSTRAGLSVSLELGPNSGFRVGIVDLVRDQPLRWVALLTLNSGPAPFLPKSGAGLLYPPSGEVEAFHGKRAPQLFLAGGGEDASEGLHSATGSPPAGLLRLDTATSAVCLSLIQHQSTPVGCAELGRDGEGGIKSSLRGPPRSGSGDSREDSSSSRKRG